MLADNIQFRDVIYASLLAPPISASREQATQLYTKLADALFPKLKLEYTPEQDVPFKIVMEEEGEARRRDCITVDICNHQLRLLVHQTWPDSFSLACKKADQVWAIFRDTVPGGEVHLAEVRLRAQLPIPVPSAKEYLTQRLLIDTKRDLPGLGNVSFLGIKFEVSPELEEPFSTLGSPARNVLIEPLRQEAGFLYLEVMSNWGRLALRMNPETPGEAQIIPGPLRTSDVAATEYIGEVRDYISECICPFLEGNT